MVWIIALVVIAGYGMARGALTGDREKTKKLRELEKEAKIRDEDLKREIELLRKTILIP